MFHMTGKPWASIVIPYHRRKHSLDNLRDSVLPQLTDQEECSIPEKIIGNIAGVLEGPAENVYRKDVGYLIYNCSSLLELIIVTDYVVHPGARGNICMKANVGIQLAKGEVLVMIDQDIAVDEDAVAKMIRHVQQNPNAFVYGMILRQMHDGDGGPLYWVGPNWQRGTSSFFACNREKLIAIGGFDEDFAYGWGWEDDELLNRARQHFDVQFVDWAGSVHMWHPEKVKDATTGDNGQHFLRKYQVLNRIANDGKPWGVIYEN